MQLLLTEDLYTKDNTKSAGKHVQCFLAFLLPFAFSPIVTANANVSLSSDKTGESESLHFRILQFVQPPSFNILLCDSGFKRLKDVSCEAGSGILCKYIATNLYTKSERYITIKTSKRTEMIIASLKALFNYD